MPAFDNSAYGGFVTNTTSQTISYTMGAGANRYLIIAALTDSGGDLFAAGSATFNGVSATRLANQSSNPAAVFRQALWGLANPFVGTANVVVTTSSSASVIQTLVISFTDVKESDIIVALSSGSADPYISSLITTSLNTMLVEFVNSSVGLIAGANFTLRTSDANPVFTVALGSSGPLSSTGSATVGVSGSGGWKQSVLLALPTAVVTAVTPRVVGGTRNIFYAPSAQLTATLSSLASSPTLTAGYESATVDNSVTLALDYFISGKITTGTSPSVGLIEVWCVPELNDTSWPDVFDGTTSVETVTTRTILQAEARLLWFVLADTTSNRTYYMPKISVASFFGGECPRKFVLFLTHNTVAPLHATNANHALYQQAITNTFSTGTYVSVPVGTMINVGDNWQTKINAGAVGETFIIATGTHRLQSVNPKASQRFIGQVGAVMSGSSLLHAAQDATLGSFVTSGAFWKIGGQTQLMANRNGSCQMSVADGGIFTTSYPGCNYCEELFIDDVRQVHVQTLAEVAAGKWFFDYGTDEITIGTNPSGHLVETSITTYAFNPVVNNVTISNLTIEKYASTAQYGAINAEGTTGWVVADCILRLNHSGGVRLGHSMQLYRNLVTRNGQEGIVGIGDNIIVDGNEISYNNDAHFDPRWEAGGTKFVQTNNLIVRNNNVHHNGGPGLWTDIDNVNTLYENNTVEDNEQIGIFHEISWSCVIRNNKVRRNGFASWVLALDYIWGSGILVAASPDTEIYGNIVEDNNGSIAAVQQNRTEPSPYGLHLISNLNVHDNTVRQSTGWTGLVQGTGDATIWGVARNNHFEANTYLCLNNTNYFTWVDLAPLTFAQWQSYGHDTPVGSATIY